MTTAKQLSPKRQKRKRPNMSEKLASALLHIRRGIGDDWLVKGELRTASAKEICAAIDWDHVRRWAEGGSNEPQNLQPLIRAEHREKSRKDTTEVAKGKRFGKKHAEHIQKVRAKIPQNTLIWNSETCDWAQSDEEAAECVERTERKYAKLRSRGFPSKEERKLIKERYAR